jgi:hypothetical protein
MDIYIRTDLGVFNLWLSGGSVCDRARAESGNAACQKSTVARFARALFTKPDTSRVCVVF